MLYLFEQGQSKVLVDLPALAPCTIGKTIKIIKDYPYGPREGEDWYLRNVDYYRPLTEDDKVELL